MEAKEFCQLLFVATFPKQAVSYISFFWFSRRFARWFYYRALDILLFYPVSVLELICALHIEQSPGRRLSNSPVQKRNVN